MTLDGENLSFKINEENLGVVFTSPLLLQEGLFACCFITDIADSVQTLRGALISYSKT